MSERLCFPLMDAHYAGFQGRMVQQNRRGLCCGALYVPAPNLGDRRGQSHSVWESFDLCIEDMRMSRGLGLGLGDIYFKYCIYILIECCKDNSYTVVNSEIKESHRILVDLLIGCGSCLYEEVKNSAFLRF